MICPIKQFSTLRRGRKKQLAFSGKLGEKQEEKKKVKPHLRLKFSNLSYGVNKSKNQETGIIRKKKNVHKFPSCLQTQRHPAASESTTIHCLETTFPTPFQKLREEFLPQEEDHPEEQTPKTQGIL